MGITCPQKHDLGRPAVHRYGHFLVSTLFGFDNQLRPKRPKTGPNGTKKGQSRASRGARWVKTGPKWPNHAPFTCPKGLEPFLGPEFVILGPVRWAAQAACPQGCARAGFHPSGKCCNRFSACGGLGFSLHFLAMHALQLGRSLSLAVFRSYRVSVN